MSGPYLPERLPKCSCCGGPCCDWRNPQEAFAGKLNAKSGAGDVENLAGWDKDGERLCELCWNEWPEKRGTPASA